MAGRKKTVYALIIVLGGGALLVDRTMLGGSSGPDDVVGASVSSSDLVSSVVSYEPSESMPIPELPFPREVPALDFKGAIRDWFKPPEGMVKEVVDDGRLGEGREGDPGGPAGRNGAEAKNSSFHLDGIVAFGKTEVAVIDGRWYREGDVLGECTVDSISGREVTLFCDAGEVSLTLFDDLLLEAVSEKGVGKVDSESDNSEMDETEAAVSSVLGRE